MQASTMSTQEAAPRKGRRAVKAYACSIPSSSLDLPGDMIVLTKLVKAGQMGLGRFSTFCSTCRAIEGILQSIANSRVSNLDEEKATSLATMDPQVINSMLGRNTSTG